MNDGAPSDTPVSSSSSSRMIAVVTGVILLWFIVRNAGLLLLTTSAPDLALRLVPASPHAVIAQLQREAFAGSKPSTGALEKLSLTIRDTPLASEPFVAAALFSRARGQSVQATRQMLEASRRDPRLVAAHAFLIEQYVRSGQIREAIAQIAIALRLPSADGTNGRLMDALYLVAHDPRAGRALEQALAANPPWRSTFVQYVASRGEDPSILFTTLRSTPQSNQEDIKLEEQRSFLNGLIAKQDYERAYLAWVNFLPPSVLDRIAPIYDGTFKKLPGPGPFNWELFSDENATAEMIDESRVPPGSALAVNFFGSVPTRIADQLLFLPPGDYRLSVTAIGNSESAMGGSFAWEVNCLPSNTQIARVDFAGLSGVPITRRVSLTVAPQSCKAQQLSLMGIPGETSAQVSAEFGAMSIKHQ